MCFQHEGGRDGSGMARLCRISPEREVCLSEDGGEKGRMEGEDRRGLLEGLGLCSAPWSQEVPWNVAMPLMGQLMEGSRG